MLSLIILALAFTLGSARPQAGSSTVDIVVTTPAGQPPCKDNIIQCNVLDKDFYCKGEYFNWAFENCRNYCGLCNYTSTTGATATAPTATNVKTTGHQEQTTVNGTCDYKGTLHYQGDVWTDDCRYNCSCIDASIGYYRCRDLCPKYTNLPPGCTIEKQPGDCCGQPTCQISSYGMEYFCPGIQSEPCGSHGNGTSCVYKGQSYQQDQTWLDGCSQSCTCTDASV